MTSESVTSPENPPPQEQHSEHDPLPLNSANSDLISAVTPSPSQATVVASSNGVASDQAFDDNEEPSYFKYLDSKEYADKFRRCESGFRQWLLAHYFSVNVYEETATIDGETILSSRWPCTRFYVDVEVPFSETVQCLDGEEESVNSPTLEITPREIPNGDVVSENNSC